MKAPAGLRTVAKALTATAAANSHLADPESANLPPGIWVTK